MSPEDKMQELYDSGDAKQRAEVCADAARYRWLKEHHLQLGPDCWIRTGDDLDDAIDAEMHAHKASASPGEPRE